MDCVVIPLLAQYRCAHRNYDSLGMEGVESVESVESLFLASFNFDGALIDISDY